ncbi:lipoprotein BA_5634 family protein [Cytobacillus dafuensis]|uniref:Lipoprotein n=1 Tax=Cytobacillus dafuensis TaxID=1742359 RepID=A0A5B8Z8A9_CYTDA|nr:lipoprotein BA_5634 family protein [Cytobacillus dafuensis]QED49325.1 hypothetical protein FSZ17_19805 [Cytobacillus dafuensis]
MKKLLSVCLTAMIAGSIMTGCSAFKEAFEKANGLILYGEEQKIDDAFNKEENELKEKDKYTIKVAEDNDQKIMILDEKTANALIEKKLLKEVKNGDDTEPITSLPEVTKGKGLLFAKQQVEKVSLDGQQVEVTYGGNKIIGDGRIYVDMFLIVDDADFSVMEGTEKTMGIMKYDKDPDKKIGTFDVERDQLVKIKE